MGEAPAGYHEHMGEYRLDRALSCLWETIRSLNVAIDSARPWEKPEAPETRVTLSGWLLRLWNTACWLEPFLPNTAHRTREALARSPMRQAEPLFPHLA